MRLIPNIWRKTVLWILGALMIAVALTISDFRTKVLRQDVEHEHGLSIPLSATNFQQKRYGVGLTDVSILSLFEIATADVNDFVGQLSINAKSGPLMTNGTPLDNGWNVWPTDSKTFVPGNASLSGMKQTWKGAAAPIEMLSCESSRGDWLHVEIWAVEDHRLIKVYTDRN